ncbi:MAG: hypothetical protein D0528_06405 [Methylococcales bacterium]|nr:MAG: hypothetical protein D0528_06405 [Methylococcales bacterium]
MNALPVADALKAIGFTTLHVADAPKAIGFTALHVADAPKAIGFTTLHVADAPKALGFTASHVADAPKAIGFTASHVADTPITIAFRTPATTFRVCLPYSTTLLTSSPVISTAFTALFSGKRAFKYRTARTDFNSWSLTLYL